MTIGNDSDSGTFVNPSRAEESRRKLWALWSALLNRLLDRVQAGDASASELAVARSFLLDNGVSLGGMPSGLALGGSLQSLKAKTASTPLMAALTLPFSVDLVTGDELKEKAKGGDEDEDGD